MNFRKTTLYILLSILLLVFVYNYVLPIFMFQNSSGMGMEMGMHMGGMRNNSAYYYNGLENFIIVIIIIVAGFILFDKVLFATRSNKCRNCGLTIESDSWKICPRCGNHLKGEGGKSK